jgi:hypothetical protein
MAVELGLCINFMSIEPTQNSLREIASRRPCIHVVRRDYLIHDLILVCLRL